MESFLLKDAWRETNERGKGYTWQRPNHRNQSRLDYIFISNTLFSSNILKSNIDPGIHSDHSCVTLSMESREDRRGPSIWKFNNSLLGNEEFEALVRAEIDRSNNNSGVYEPEMRLGIKIDMLFCNIRQISMKCSKKIAHERRKDERDLEILINNFEADLQVLSEEELATYNDTKEKLSELKLTKARAAMLFSKTRWVEEGERATKYFLRRGKQLSAQKVITELVDGERMITGNKQILETCASHFEKLYAKEDGVDDEAKVAYIQETPLPRLSNEDKDKCEGDVDLEECTYALGKMARNKSPGVSGFSPEFLLHFWSDIGPLIVQYINQSRNEGLFITHRRGIITLIPKKGDQRLLKNKRPVCLLDVTYKLIAKIVSIRISTVIDGLVERTQTGFIRGRHIGENIRLMQDIIEYCNDDQLSGLLLSLDFANAFDRLNHDYIIHTLRAFNFGESLISWVNLLLRNVELTVMNNGYTSRWIPVQRSALQGSCISSFIFILAVEVLAVKIKMNRNIQGIQISKQEHKISLYADDINLLLANKKSALEAFTLLDEFEQISGLKLNMQKCKLMWLGRLKDNNETVKSLVPEAKIKSLGVVFSASFPCHSENAESVSKAISTTLNIWQQRDLTIKGRITISKALLISKMVYIGSTGMIPKRYQTEIQSKIMRFIWRGRPPKVAKTVLCQQIKDGGLNAVDINIFCNSLKLAWAAKVFKEEQPLWKKLLQARVGRCELDDLFKTYMNKKTIKSLKIAKFYEEVLFEFQKYTFRFLTSYKDVQREPLWYNSQIHMGSNNCFKTMYPHNIKIIDDILDINGNIMNFQDLRRKYPNIRTNFLEYHGLKIAIPGLWADLLQNGNYRPVSQTDREEPYEIKINGEWIPAKDIKSKQFYSDQLFKQTPAAQIRWEGEGHSMQWKRIYEIPYQCTKSTRLQSLQYRILHRYIPTQRYLFIRGATSSEKCKTCDHTDTPKHFIFYCHDVQPIWEFVKRKLDQANHNIPVSLNVSDVIFGLTKGKQAQNVIILLAKQYIINCKLGTEYLRPNINTLNQRLKENIEIERKVALNNNKLEKFQEKWNGYDIANLS